MAASCSKLTRRRLFTLLSYFDRPISIRECGSFNGGAFFFINGRARALPYPNKHMDIEMSVYGFRSESLRPCSWEKSTAEGQRNFRKRVIERKSMLRRWIRQYQGLRLEKAYSTDAEPAPSRSELFQMLEQKVHYDK